MSIEKKKYQTALGELRVTSQKALRQAYLDTIEDIAKRIAISAPGDGPFLFNEHPALKKKLDTALNDLSKKVEEIILEGAKAADNLAAERYDDIVQGMLTQGDAASILSKTQMLDFAKTESTRAATEAFVKRKIAGMGLSDRVWQNTQRLRENLEVALQGGIEKGTSAAKLSQDIRNALNQPNSLYRRVRNKETGKLELSKAAKDYKPGTGVYRSSYKNALRMSGTEINIAYRSAFHTRIQPKPWITGIEIRLSNNHTCKGADGKLIRGWTDICDDLAGVYPKDFIWTGWHPHCRCEQIIIHQDPVQAIRDFQNGTTTAEQIKDMPPQWKDYLEKNKEMLERRKAAGKSPYYIRDNTKYVTKIKPAIQNETKLGKLIELADINKIEFNPPRISGTTDTTSIVERLGGGDLTKGSCSSLALAYAGNKAGLDVLDFRGGSSLSLFAQQGTIRNITAQVGGLVESAASDFTSGLNLLGKIENGKEYYFCCGKHAAIARRSEKGLEYLELQSATDNGWWSINKAVLKNRFGAQKSHSLYGTKFEVPSYLIDIDLLNADPGFKELLGYINTKTDNQLKGAKGRIK